MVELARANQPACGEMAGVACGGGGKMCWRFRCDGVCTGFVRAIMTREARTNDNRMIGGGW